MKFFPDHFTLIESQRKDTILHSNLIVDIKEDSKGSLDTESLQNLTMDFAEDPNNPEEGPTIIVYKFNSPVFKSYIYIYILLTSRTSSRRSLMKASIQ